MGEWRQLETRQRIDEVIVAAKTKLHEAKFFEITVETIGLGIDRNAIDPLQVWKDLYNITNMSADGDKDGLNNLLEYALDRNPGTSDFRPGIRNRANPSQSVFSEFDVYVSSSAEGITYRVKASNSLDRTNATTLATFTSANGTSSYRKVTDTQPISTSARRFAWVEVILP